MEKQEEKKKGEGAELDPDLLKLRYYFYRNYNAAVKGVIPQSTPFYNQLWTERIFAKGPLQKVIDQEMREQFLPTYERFRRGELESWKKTNLGRAGLVMILDQVPRNMFRGTKEMYQTDPAILALVLGWIDQKLDLDCSPIERAIMYFPLIHSENAEHQRLSVKKYDELQAFKDGFNNLALESFAKIAENHFGPIMTFGRFPERNAVLKRQPTPEEKVYLSAIYSAAK